MVLAERQVTRERAHADQTGSTRDRNRRLRRRLKVVRNPEDRPYPEVRTKYRLRLGRFLGTVALIFLMAFILISGYTRITAMGYHVSELKRQINKLQADNEYLRVQIASLETPSRVEETARQSGMNYGTELRVADVNPDVVAAAARSEPQGETVVLSLLDAPRVGNGDVQLATAGSPESLEVVSRWFFRWLTGVRAVEAGSIR